MENENTLSSLLNIQEAYTHDKDGWCCHFICTLHLLYSHTRIRFWCSFHEYTVSIAFFFVLPCYDAIDGFDNNDDNVVDDGDIEEVGENGVDGEDGEVGEDGEDGEDGVDGVDEDKVEKTWGNYTWVEGSGKRAGYVMHSAAI